MAFTKYYDEQNPPEHPPCIHLRSKAMCVTGSLCAPDHPDEEGSQYCWCNMTQHLVGPDENYVDATKCVPERPCYRSTYA